MTELTFEQKMLALYERVAYVQKTGVNSHFKYSFIQESVMKRKLNAACRELGLVLSNVEVQPVGECTAALAVVRVTITIENDSTTDFVRIDGIGGGMDKGDKAPQKALTAAFKSALGCGLMVETGDDAEGDAATDEAAFESVLEAIEAAEDTSALELLKPRIVELKGGEGHAELVEAFKARKKALDPTR